MTYEQLAYFHLATVVPAFMIATSMFVMRKGTRLHKIAGRVYMVLMLITAVASLFMPATIGPVVLSHFGFLHALALLAIYAIVNAYLAIQKGDVKTHVRSMVGLYIGGLLIAGGFTLMPGRMINVWLFG